MKKYDYMEKEALFYFSLGFFIWDDNNAFCILIKNNFHMDWRKLMLYNIYLENSYGQEFPLYLNVEKDSTFDRIKSICKKANFEISMFRTWNRSDNIQVIDVGSHYELFIVKKVHGGDGIEYKITGWER